MSTYKCNGIFMCIQQYLKHTAVLKIELIWCAPIYYLFLYFACALAKISSIRRVYSHAYKKQRECSQFIFVRYNDQRSKCSNHLSRIQFNLPFTYFFIRKWPRDFTDRIHRFFLQSKFCTFPPNAVMYPTNTGIFNTKDQFRICCTALGVNVLFTPPY